MGTPAIIIMVALGLGLQANSTPKICGLFPTAALETHFGAKAGAVRGAVKLPTTTCFLDHGGYLSLSLRSENPTHLGFEAVRTLLEQTAAKRR